MSEVDGRILRFVAVHPVVLLSHVQTLLRAGDEVAVERLDRLCAEGLIRRGPRLRHQFAGYQITRRGLAEIGSDLPVPRVDLRRYWDHIGVAWLSLFAEAGTFGEIDRMFCEREMRAADQAAAAAEASAELDVSAAVRAKVADAAFGVRLASDASGDPVLLHYPDLVLVVPQGRIAVELQLTAIGRDPLDRILAAYARKPSVTVVLFLVNSGSVGLAVQAAAARLGLAREVHVQPVELGYTSH